MGLYEFQNLWEFVKVRYGVDPDRVRSTFQPIRERLTRQQLDDKVELLPDGIVFTDEEGVKHRGFLFIEGGYNKEWAQRRGIQSIIPRFHSCNCEVIERQKRKLSFNGHYVFSNQPESMEDLDKVVKEVSLCSKCAQNMPELGYPMNSSEFVEKVVKKEEIEQGFNNHHLPTEIQVTSSGYTPQWAEKSKDYRQKMNFTCENPQCGIQLNKGYADGFFLETHHISGVKTDNRDANLMCLCVLCHANTNEDHRLNYSRGANRRKMALFLENYKSTLQRVKNPYLDEWLDRLRIN